MSDHASMASTAGEDEEPTNSGQEGHNRDANEEEEERDADARDQEGDGTVEDEERDTKQRHINMNLLVNTGQERGQSPGGQMTS